MAFSRPMKGITVWALATGIALAVSMSPASAAEPEQSRTNGGLTVYLGLIPAEIVKGTPREASEKAMHGGVPRSAREYHVVAAVFDAATGARVSDGSITAQVSGLGLSGQSKTLEPMQIAGTTTYGAFFNLPGRDLYTVKLSVVRGRSQPPMTFEFKYDHR